MSTMRPPLPFNATDLQNARANLKAANRDQALVDRFTTIRGLQIVFGGENPAATLADAEVQLLKELRSRSSPVVTVAPQWSPSNYGGGTSAEMVFTTTFRARIQAGPPFRVIRFVRAAQVNRNMVWTKEEFTVPGYVHYETGANPMSKTRPSPGAIRDALVRSLGRARWSFDGPREEFRAGLLVNVDTPGTKSSDLPYGITAEFLIALYDENARRILEVGYSQGSYLLWPNGADKRSSFVQGGPAALQTQ